MKKMMKLSAGLLLGAMLCLGILVTPAPANAYYWACGSTVFWCADVVVTPSGRFCNTGFWCGPNVCYGSAC
jgi:hypothetical protein